MEDKKNYYININNVHVDVSEEVYTEYKRMARRDKYLEERDKKNNLIFINDTFENEAMDDSRSIEDMVQLKDITKVLYACLSTLSEKEVELINYIYYKQLSLREISKIYEISPVAVYKRSKRIIDKLKKLMEKKGY